MPTSKKNLSKAGKALKSPRSTKSEKSIAAEALRLYEELKHTPPKKKSR